MFEYTQIYSNILKLEVEEVGNFVPGYLSVKNRTVPIILAALC